MKRKFVRASFALALSYSLVCMAAVSNKGASLPSNGAISLVNATSTTVARSLGTASAGLDAPTIKSQVTQVVRKKLNSDGFRMLKKLRTLKAKRALSHPSEEGGGGGCFRSCLEESIPPELLIACAVVCGGGVTLACAACLGYFAGAATGCAIGCNLAKNRVKHPQTRLRVQTV